MEELGHRLPTLSQSDRSHFTVVFRGNIRDLPKGPFNIESGFGEAVSSGYGNAFEKADALEEALYRALPFVEEAVNDPGNDRRAVNDVLRLIRAALGEG